MNSFYTDKLSNNIKVIIRKNPNTPRVAINLYMGSGAKYEKIPGTSSLLCRLMLQGTETRTAEQIANELDSNAIELGTESKQDYLRVRALFLNEDFEKAINLFQDVIKNSTFDNLDKERLKFLGELKLELDSPKTQAFDNLVKTIFQDHPYGHPYTTIIKSLPSIQKNDIKEYYENTSFIPERMLFSIVGDVDREEVLKVLEENFGKIPAKQASTMDINPLEITESKIVTIAKQDAAQAQILQGWVGTEISSEDYPAVILLNTILGASGLSSRLFVELRDKQGLAYHVRSSVEALKHMGLITVYIGTAPENIQTCLKGFEIEINKLKQELVTEDELNGAKLNYLGKRAFMHETNAQQAYYLGYYESMGVGVEFDSELENKIKQVSSLDIQNAANKYFSENSVISLVAQKEFLS